MRPKEKIRYEVDPFNRLILPGFRSVAEGEFAITKGGLLAYRLKKPSSFLPQELKLSGNWSLDKNHNLVLTLDKENNQRAGDKLTLEGEIIDVAGDKMVFSLVSKNTAGRTRFYILRLSGKWQADKYNRLAFLIAKDRDAPDKLTLSGSWEVNRRNQLSYTYIKTGLKTRDKITRSITFKGYWDINQKNRLSYVLDKNLNSVFDFQVSWGRPAKRGLQYELGLGAGGVKKKLLLFGSWKINPRLGLIFQMPLGKEKNRDLLFGANCRLDEKDNLELKLKDTRQHDLGIELKLTRTLPEGLGEAYIKALKEGKEISLLAGIGFRW
jgi:hypothetical protein